MKKYINGELTDVIPSEQDHNKRCSCRNLLEVSKIAKDGKLVIIKYLWCPECERYIVGKVIDVSDEYY